MKKILILGAGMSASTLIKYLLEKSATHKWSITVADINLDVAKKKIGNCEFAQAKTFDITDENSVTSLIKDADIVVSMMPALFHPIVAKHCLAYSKHLFTASYVSAEMKAMNEEATKKGLLFFNECGVDPGIDHMSAMKIIDEIKEKGGKIIGFESYCGGLVAPESDNNPWNYKFTWNARNVILAGQAGAHFLQNGKYKYIPFSRLYERIDKTRVNGFGDFEIYANRDSLSYREVYGLEDVKTIIRGTLRRPGYCAAWNTFVQLGVTDDTYQVVSPEKLTNRSFIEAFLPHNDELSVEDNFCNYLKIDKNSDIFKRMKWLDLFEEKPIKSGVKTPAQILQSIIEPKWKLEEKDLDLLVMQHIFTYEIDGKKHKKVSSMGLIGQDSVHTAMAITVGMPMAICIEAFANGSIGGVGVQTPVKKEYYLHILEELKKFNIVFEEEQVS